MIKSEICEMLGIRYPVFQGGMAWIADGKLAAAVSDGGGLGIIAAGNAPGDYVREQIQIARSLTIKPHWGKYHVDSVPIADDVAKIVIEEKIEVVTTGAGNPSKYMKSMEGRPEFKSFPSSLRLLWQSLLTQTRCHRALIAEGGESGGHVGELTTMVLVPQMCDATTLPVIAAGGIADGRGVAAALMLGACGVQMGTRFLSADGMLLSTQTYKEKILKATDLCTMVTGKRLGSSGHAAFVRSLPEIIPKRNTAECRMRNWRRFATGALQTRRSGRRQRKGLFPGGTDSGHGKKRTARRMK